VSLVCVGSAGSGSPEARDVLEAHLRPLSRDGTVRVVNDVRLVLAADLDDGIAVVAGTGSNCVGCSTAARSAPAAGAACLATRAARTGREAVRDVLQAFHDEPGPPGWARHAAAVLGCGDTHADTLLRDTADAIAGLVVDCARRLSAPAELPAVLAGGLLTGHAELAAATRARLRELRPAASSPGPPRASGRRSRQAGVGALTTPASLATAAAIASAQTPPAAPLRTPS